MLAGSQQDTKLGGGGKAGRKSIFVGSDAVHKEGWLNKIFEEICNAVERNAAEFSELFAQ
jgi:hypothetical protein